MSPYDMHLHIHIAYICSMMHEPWPPCPMTHVHAMSHVPCHILTMIRASCIYRYSTVHIFFVTYSITYILVRN